MQCRFGRGGLAHGLGRGRESAKSDALPCSHLVGRTESAPVGQRARRACDVMTMTIAVAVVMFVCLIVPYGITSLLSSTLNTSPFRGSLRNTCHINLPTNTQTNTHIIISSSQYLWTCVSYLSRDDDDYPNHDTAPPWWLSFHVPRGSQEQSHSSAYSRSSSTPNILHSGQIMASGKTYSLAVDACHCPRHDSGSGVTGGGGRLFLRGNRSRRWS